jgi:omega-hydroxy-beta-dihydromenaquinone-9 sulfotransferase
MPAADPKKKKSFGEWFKEAFVMPRFWHGMLFSDWVKLAAKNRFAFSPSKLLLACGVTILSVINSTLRFIQEFFFAKVVDKTGIRKPPIFIIGHWRSGTTLLHELMVLDDRHIYPTTYQCFAPNHFLLSEGIVNRWFGFVLPSKRPMDDMATGWDKPQEDEFALCNLGVPSPYESMCFPNHPTRYPEYLNMEGLSEAALTKWRDTMLWFLKRISFKSNRRIILKSPPHTARIKVLLDIFPDAKFIHIVRDPYVLFPSTVRLWKSLNELQGMQVPKHEGLEEYVFSCFERMYSTFEKQRALVDSARFYELRYEDLIADPVKQIQAIYEQFELGDFDEVAPKLNAYFEQKRDYRVNKHNLDPALRDEITRRWGNYIERYGYTLPEEVAK